MEKFEGPEKKLEIIFSAPQVGLRDNRDGRWDRVVRTSGAEILNGISTPRLDGYLLSESSLFVWDDRVLMITCGRTAPVMALPEMLSFIDREKIAFLFYDRKNLNFPEEQFTDYEFDREYLAHFFPGISTRVGPSDQDHVHLFYHGNGRPAPAGDTTLRILMHDIDPAVADRFVFRGKYASGWHDTLGNLSCIDGSMQLDQYFFQPQGYSLNGISGKHYVTVHVTPEPEASYTSIETNRSDINPCWMVDEVIERFQPGRFSVFLRTSRQTGCPQMHEPLPETLGAYTTTQHTLREFGRHYTVTFTNYRRNDAFT